tara:strand:- start:3116 stop:3268 length:153 start_codon:yes stop_codon:yes gene_type:complete
MKKENKIELMKFIYKIDALGVNNSMLRKEFDKLDKKQWREFIDKLTKKLE